MSTTHSVREFLDCVEIFERHRLPRTTKIAATTLMTTPLKRSSSTLSSLAIRTPVTPPRKKSTSLPKSPGAKIRIVSRTPPNPDVGRWFVQSVEIPVKRAKASPKEKTGLGGGLGGHHAVPNLKSRVKDLFGSDESSDAGEEMVMKVAKAAPLSQAEKDAERERKQEALLLDIFGGDDDDLLWKPKERRPTEPEDANDTVVFSKSIFASKNRDHDRIQEDTREMRYLKPTSPHHFQLPLKKPQPRLQPAVQPQQSPSKRVTKPPKKTAAIPSSSSESEDSEGHLGNQTVVNITSSAPRAFQQKERKRSMGFDQNRAATSQPVIPTQAKPKSTKVSSIMSVASNKSRVRTRIHSSEDDLQSEVKSLAKVTRLTKRRAMPQKNRFTRNLEKLKRARLGLSPLPSSSDSSGGGGSDDDSDDGDGFNLAQRQRIPNKRDKDFIVDDMGEAEHNLSDIPDEFRLSSHQDLDTDFKIYIQYLLNLSFDSDFERKHEDDKYFKHSVTHVVKTLGSYQTSMTVSQKWSKQFRRQLDIRPYYKKEYIPSMGLPCDACQIVTRPATQRVVIYGEKYVLPTSLRDASYLEDYDHSDSGHSSESDSDSDVNDSNKKSVETTFNVGKTCCQRSYIYHKLRHWTYHCARKIEKDIPEVQRQEATRKKVVDTNLLLEKLEEKGVVKKLLSEFKQALNEARDLEHGKD
ncbi:hypothetical protein EMPS_01070 [Entomortierella parvispora]|uniref:DUF4211 domain-containing protein n=1 Tax=Entomortierella parvispora TaxID=205924 RepID=A0A9P3LSC1_9FUNG|nr:hypothetical protein EMPS_01070 [Entomortierella parvispora]